MLRAVNLKVAKLKRTCMWLLLRLLYQELKALIIEKVYEINIRATCLFAKIL